MAGLIVREIPLGYSNLGGLVFDLLRDETKQRLAAYHKSIPPTRSQLGAEHRCLFHVGDHLEWVRRKVSSYRLKF